MRARPALPPLFAVPALKGGAALKQAIHIARARTDITSDMELARRSQVSYDTFMNWFGDKTTPRPHEVKKVADVLGVSYGDLIAAWEGEDPEPKPLADAIRDLIVELRLDRLERRESIDALVRALTARADPVPTMDVPAPDRKVSTG